MKRHIATLALLLACTLCASAQQSNPTARRYGSTALQIGSLEEWEQVHRPVIMNFFEQEVYGLMPQRQVSISYKVVEEAQGALGGRAIRRQVAMHIDGMNTPVYILMYIPANAQGPVPAFLGMNFKGNHQTNPDEAIIPSPNAPVTEGEPLRGAASSRWPMEYVVESGYAVVTLNRDNVDPDFDDGFQNGPHPLFYATGQTAPKANEWGTIGAWAWSLSRVMDYLQTDKDIDSNKVAVIGHSRLGKATLWAGAHDSRFALVISNSSGCGGAALSVNNPGESIDKINKVFPYWFCDNFNKYRNNEDGLLVDQQGLIALVAPRPVYVASATQDRWAYSVGEFQSALFASPIYELYGLKGLKEPMPAPDSPAMDGHVGYHVRSGVHDITLYDWQQYVAFADKHFFGK